MTRKQLFRLATALMLSASALALGAVWWWATIGFDRKIGQALAVTAGGLFFIGCVAFIGWINTTIEGLS